MVSHVIHFFLVSVAFMLVLYVHTRLLKNYIMKRDQGYVKALKDWERLQAWFVREKPCVPFSVSLFLDSGRIVTVKTDDAGKLVLPSGLTAVELGQAVNILMFSLGFPGKEETSYDEVSVK